MQPNPSIPGRKDIACNSTASPSGVSSSDDTASDRTALPSSVPSGKDIPPEQPLICSRAAGSTSHSTSAAPVSLESSPSCCTDVGRTFAVSKSLTQANCNPQQAQLSPVERLAEGQGSVSDHQSPSCSRLTPSDAEASSIDEQALQSCPAKAEGKA